MDLPTLSAIIDRVLPRLQASGVTHFEWDGLVLDWNSLFRTHSGPAQSIPEPAEQVSDIQSLYRTPPVFRKD